MAEHTLDTFTLRVRGYKPQYQKYDITYTLEPAHFPDLSGRTVTNRADYQTARFSFLFRDQQGDIRKVCNGSVAGAYVKQFNRTSIQESLDLTALQITHYEDREVELAGATLNGTNFRSWLKFLFANTLIDKYISLGEYNPSQEIYTKNTVPDDEKEVMVDFFWGFSQLVRNLSCHETYPQPPQVFSHTGPIAAPAQSGYELFKAAQKVHPVTEKK